MRSARTPGDRLRRLIGCADHKRFAPKPRSDLGGHLTKGGSTDQVLFYDMQADGYSLDDKRTPITDNDIPDVLEKWRRYSALYRANDTAAREQLYQFARAWLRAYQGKAAINCWPEAKHA